MKYILPVVLVMIVFFVGLYASKESDRFINKNKEHIKNNSLAKTLICGSSEVSADIEKYFKVNGIEYDVIYDNNIRELDKGYKSLIVLFNDDLDNLMFCTLSKKLYNIGNVISVCNKLENKMVFDKYGVMSIGIKDIYSKRYLSIIKEKIKYA